MRRASFAPPSCSAVGATCRRISASRSARPCSRPDLGAVYRLNDNSVIRSGYGITYNPLPFSRPLRGFYLLTIAAAYYADEPYG